MNFLDWKGILINDLDWAYAIEILIRTLIMFIFVLAVLRASGKRGVRQLSLFEVAIIIALGSAAGDPMFQKDMAIIPSIIVFAVILMAYRLLTYLASRHETVEHMLEGKPMYIVEDGMFVMHEQSEHNFSQDEFFAEMRLQSIEHLGQVRTAILETNGQVSFFYFSDDEVRSGLPVLPKLYLQKASVITTSAYYACAYCGKVEEISAVITCPRCSKVEWIKAIATKRQR